MKSVNKWKIEINNNVVIDIEYFFHFNKSKYFNAR